MQISDFRHKYMISLSDTSDHIINGKMRMDGFACHQLLLPDSPGFAISKENCEKAFGAGDIIFVAAGRVVGIRCEGAMRLRHIAFTSRRLYPFLHYCGFGDFRVIHLPEKDKKTFADRFDNIFCYNGSQVEKSSEISAALYSLIGALGAACIESDNYVHDKHRLIIKPIVDYMKRNYRTARLSYDKILMQLGITRGEMDRLFVSVFSLSPEEYYKKLRMENAKHLIFCVPNYDVDYVAKIMDYKNTSQFCVDFFDVFKITPGKFISLYSSDKRRR